MKEKPLRKKQAPMGVSELLSVANKLLYALDPARLKEPARTGETVPEPPRTLGKSYVHDKIVNAYNYGVDEDTLRYYLGRAVEQLPEELQAFVKPDAELLEPGTARWEEAIGASMVVYALGVSGPLTFTESGEPRFAGGEVEAMRQRYLFLFAVLEIMRGTAKVNVSLDEALLWLEGAQLYSSPGSAAYQVKKFRGYITINPQTRTLAFYKPHLFRVLEGVEAERIRECPVCEKLFWAGRLDQKACSPRCSNVRRGRQWRKRYSEQYKQQRMRKADDKKQRGVAGAEPKRTVKKGREGR